MFRGMRQFPWVISLVLLGTGWYTTPARSDFVVSTAAGAKDKAHDPIAAQATFHFGKDSIQITLRNLVVDQEDAGQTVTRFSFTVVSAAHGASLTSSSGTRRTLHPGGTYTDVAVSNTGWGFHSTKGNALSLDWFHRDKSITGHQAQYTLLGAPGGNNKYDNANPSLLNRAHDPELAGPLTFNLAVKGIASSSEVSDFSSFSFSFAFGTNRGDNHPGSPSGPSPPPQLPPLSTPAPPGFALALSGIGVLGLAVLRFRRRSQPVAG